MKICKYTSALVVLEIVSVASVAQAQLYHTYFYVVGSTAARAAFFGAATTPGDIFNSTAINETGATVGATDMVFEGSMSNAFGAVDLICHWSGSEAGISAVAGQPLQQPDTVGIPGYNAGNFNVPGVQPQFLVEPSDGGNWTTTASLTSDNGGRGVTTPDLCMADNSQAVSLTAPGDHPLHDFGKLAVVPFTFMEGYGGSPSFNNVTTAEITQIINGENPASLLTGNGSDETTNVALVGGNKGSGARVNTLLNADGFNYATFPVDQWAFDVSYDANALTYGGDYGSGQTLQELSNDGLIDDGSSLAEELEVNERGATDGSNPVVLIGYLDIGDANIAHNGTSGVSSGPATYLPFNGVYEGDQSVIQGNYPYWGTEHLLGSLQEGGYLGAPPLTLGQNIAAGVLNYVSAAYGTATGNVTTSPQSILIPTSLMQVSRGEVDLGNPTWVGAGNF